MAQYASLAIAPSTRRAYAHGEKRYRDFCRASRWDPLPANDNMLSSFATVTARYVKPGTVYNYIAVVRNLHLEHGMEDLTAKATLLPRVLKGIKRAHGTTVTKSRLPITGGLMCKLIDQLQVDVSICRLDRLMLKAALLLAFHSFLRCAEFVANEHSSFDPKFDATRDSVSVKYRGRQPSLEFHVKRSKTDPFAKGMTIYIGPAATPYCPVTAMVEYLSYRRSEGTAPLFQRASGVTITRQYLVTKVRGLLIAAGVPRAQEYGGHSFRIGAATSAAACGIPEWQIRALGRWQSDCVLRYIRSNPSDLTYVASVLQSSPI